MGELTCYIHKDRTAIDRCSTCRKYICLECKRPSRNSDYYDDSKHYVCPLCLAREIEEKEENQPGLVFVFSICFIFVIFIIIAFGLSSMGSSNLEPESDFGGFIVAIVIIIFFGLMGIGVYVAIKKEKKKEPIKQATEIRAKVKKAMEESSKKVAILTNEDGQRPLYCKFCGAPLQKDKNECEYCGMVWIFK
jgi:hypothetical protein